MGKTETAFPNMPRLLRNACMVSRLYRVVALIGLWLMAMPSLLSPLPSASSNNSMHGIFNIGIAYWSAFLLFLNNILGEVRKKIFNAILHHYHMLIDSTGTVLLSRVGKGILKTHSKRLRKKEE